MSLVVWQGCPLSLMSQQAYRHTKGEFIMQGSRKQVENWINFYTAIVESASVLKRQQFPHDTRDQGCQGNQA